MNRVLKFRFWTPDKRMIDDHEGWVEDIGINAALSYSREYGYIQMQFSGFVLKNKELYESDIVRIEEEGEEDDNRNYYVCTWIKEWAMFALLHTENEYFQYLESGVAALDEFLYWTYVFDEKENIHKNICGNIYQNPELLQPNKDTINP